MAVGIVEGGGGSAGHWGGDSCHVTHDMNFCNFFNLLSFTIPNKALYIKKLEIGNNWNTSYVGVRRL